MKRESLHLPGGISIETGPDWNGRYYVAYRRGVSMFFRDVDKLRKFLDLYAKAARRESLDSWLASLQAADAAKEDKPQLQQLPEGTSFDPLDHEDDPALSTKMVI
jgi:hypothetical protein